MFLKNFPEVLQKHSTFYIILKHGKTYFLFFYYNIWLLKSASLCTSSNMYCGNKKNVEDLAFLSISEIIYCLIRASRLCWISSAFLAFSQKRQVLCQTSFFYWITCWYETKIISQLPASSAAGQIPSMVMVLSIKNIYFKKTLQCLGLIINLVLL